MDWKIVMTTFWAIFIAELGDKTQLAAITMTSKTKLPVSVFIGAVLALATVTLIGVVFGEALVRVVPENIIKKAAAVVFIVIGILIFWGKM
ncbi:TMEM165/GDT1 family protein [bacterium]|nr:TMEM165/GDT1 family protein [bacterium]